MLDQISRIIKECSVNVREAMNYVRSSVLFKEIDEINTNVVNEIVGEFARNKIYWQHIIWITFNGFIY